MLGEILYKTHFRSHSRSRHRLNESESGVNEHIDLTKLMKQHGMITNKGEERSFQKFRETGENMYSTTVRGDRDGSLVTAEVYTHPEINGLHEVRITHRVGGVTIVSSETFLRKRSWGGSFQITQPDDTRVIRFGSSRCEVTGKSNQFYSCYLHVNDAQNFLLGNESVTNGFQMTSDFLSVLFRE